MNESSILREIMVTVSKEGARVFRNNCGMLRDEQGRYIRYGVANPGGADLIGWTAKGRFLAIEVKRPGERPKQEQINFIDTVNKAGGIGFVATSALDAATKIKEATCQEK